MSRAPWCVAIAGLLLAACDDRLLHAFEPQASGLGGEGGPGPHAEAGGGYGGMSSSDPLAGAGSAEPNSPLIDDFEDGDARAKEPRGWWYPVNDGTGTQGFGIEPVSRGTASVYALRTHGSGFQDWGAALGVNLVGDSTPLRALSYQKLCFEARVEGGSSTSIEVHFVHESEQHYTQQVSLSETWTRFCLPLSDFIGPDEAAFTPNQLIALQFFFAPESRFELWLDDVELEQ